MAYLLALRDTYLCYRALNVSGSGILSREEFSKFYEVWNLRWKPYQSPQKRMEWTFFREFGLKLQNLLYSPYSNHFFSKFIRIIFLFLNFVEIIVENIFRFLDCGQWCSDLNSCNFGNQSELMGFIRFRHA